MKGFKGTVPRDAGSCEVVSSRGILYRITRWSLLFDFYAITVLKYSKSNKNLSVVKWMLSVKRALPLVLL
jgi:hypothetical protein